MGLNFIVAQQLWGLWKEGELEGHKSIIELSPHDLGSNAGRRTAFRDFARQKFGDTAAVQEFEDSAFNSDGTVKPLAHVAFYKLFGLEEYECIDFIDDRATYKLDLNMPVDIGKTFDVVAEYGTAEHIFNIGQFFANAYDLLRPGGIVLHFLPTMGQVYHGFYNIHNVVYRSLVAAELYEPLRLIYIPAVPRQLRQAERRLEMPKVYDISEREAPHTTLRFYLTDMLYALTGQQRQSACVFAALRRKDDKPFRYPQQINKYWVQ